MRWPFPSNHKSPIQYTVDGYIVEIAGTNELADFHVSLQCWSKPGWHAGAYKEAIKLYDKVYLELSHYDLVLVKGYSMGGAIAQILAWILKENTTCDVVCQTNGAFPVSLKRRKIHGVCNIYGNDPVPALFPWFRQCVKKKYIGPRRWFPFILKDHVRY